MDEIAGSERAPTDYAGFAPEMIATLARLTAHINHSGLEPSRR